MRAMILAAGFGTRLKPWTDFHPKALVEVGGMPMLGRILRRLGEEGFDEVIVNTHHFPEQIHCYIENWEGSSQRILFSDEKGRILDTGGGVLMASRIIGRGQPMLVHNVDILSDLSLRDVMSMHEASCNDISLVTGVRESTRALLFDKNSMLAGWHDLRKDIYRPEKYRPDAAHHGSAFSGIYVIDSKGYDSMEDYVAHINDEAFPLIDFLLWAKDKIKIGEIRLENLNLIDIGKPDTLCKANRLFMRDDADCGGCPC